MKAEIRRFGDAGLLYGEFVGTWSLGWRAESLAPRPMVEVFPGNVLLDRRDRYVTLGHADLDCPPDPFGVDVEAVVREGDEIMLGLDISHGPLASPVVPEVERRRPLGDPLLLTGSLADGVLRVNGTTAFKWRPEEGAEWQRADLCVGFRGTAVEGPTGAEGEAA